MTGYKAEFRCMIMAAHTGARLNCRKTACLLLRYLSMMKISCLAKYPVNKTPYYKISKKNGKLTSIPITVKERIRDGLSYTVGDGAFGYVSLLMSPVARLGSDILIADYSLDTAYVYRDDHLIPLTVRRNHTSENNIPILATVDVMTGRYLLWYTIVKDIDVKNNHVSDPVAYLYDRFTNEYCQVDLVNRDGVSATNVPIFQMRLSANYHVVP